MVLERPLRIPAPDQLASFATTGSFSGQKATIGATMSFTSPQKSSLPDTTVCYFPSVLICACFDAYVGSPSVATRNPFEVSLANFTVKAGSNRLQRNVAGGQVESGALQRGKTVPTNLTLNTLTGTWNVTGFNNMFITYPPANKTS